MGKSWVLMPEYLVSGPNSVAYQLPHFWQVLKALKTRSHVKVTIMINYNTTCRREGWTLQRDMWNFGGGGRYVHYLDYDDGYTGVHICQNSTD